MIILEENFKWHLEAFEIELFIYTHTHTCLYIFKKYFHVFTVYRFKYILYYI